MHPFREFFGHVIGHVFVGEFRDIWYRIRIVEFESVGLFKRFVVHRMRCIGSSRATQVTLLLRNTHRPPLFWISVFKFLISAMLNESIESLEKIADHAKRPNRLHCFNRLLPTVKNILDDLYVFTRSLTMIK